MKSNETTVRVKFSLAISALVGTTCFFIGTAVAKHQPIPCPLIEGEKAISTSVKNGEESCTYVRSFGRATRTRRAR